MTRFSLVISVVLGLAPVAVAQPPRDKGGLEYTPPAPPAAPDPAGLVFRLVGLTAGMIALCGGVLWLGKRAQRMSAGTTDPTGRIRHDGSLPLDRRCVLHMLRVEGHAVAVTTDATGLRSVTLLSEPFDAALAEAGVPPHQ